MKMMTHQQIPKDRCTHSLQPGQYMWNYWRNIHGHIHHSWFHSSTPQTLVWRKKKSKSHQRWHVNVSKHQTRNDTTLYQITPKSNVLRLWIFKWLFTGRSSQINKCIRWKVDCATVCIRGNKLYFFSYCVCLINIFSCWLILSYISTFDILKIKG